MTQSKPVLQAESWYCWYKLVMCFLSPDHGEIFYCLAWDDVTDVAPIYCIYCTGFSISSGSSDESVPMNVVSSLVLIVNYFMILLVHD